LASLSFSTAGARELTLDEAIDIAVNKSGRGGIIRGNLEVAEQQYFAEKIGFYLPEVSINGTLPAYGSDERWGYLYGTDTKKALREPYLNFQTDLTLKQSLITGGELTASADLSSSDGEHPNRLGIQVDESSRLGRFNFSLTQPVLQPSQPKYDLRNRHDDLELARLKQAEDAAGLQKEVIEAFFGVLQSEIATDMGSDELRKAQLQASIDSAKLADGVVSEEQSLESVASRLDAELKLYEYEDDATNQRRTLATLLDVPSLEQMSPMTPETITQIDSSTLQKYLQGWEDCIPLMKAKFELEKENRSAHFTASSHGLTGMLTASYNLSRGEVEDAGIADDLRTDSWQVRLDLSYPIWDGGASGAAVKAARLSAEQARLEHQKTEKSVRAEIAALVNQLNVSYRKLDVLRQKIAIEETKLDIASSRLDDGQISELTYLDNRISFLEAKSKYLDEMRTYYSTKVDLQSKYLD
jgi:outer membrane protein TolC